jgi:hypothetical protein
MATWKKVVVSGSNAELNKLNVGANQQISSSVATTFLSGSFSGSFEGNLRSQLSNANQPDIVGYDAATGLFTYQGTGSFTATTASYVTGSGVYGPYGSNSILSASFAVTAAYASNVPATASYALQALSASYATSASSAVNANTASYVLQAVSASFATNASTASYVNPLNQAVLITGSLDVLLTGSSTFQLAGNNFQQTYISTAGALVLNPGSGGVGMAGLNQYIQANYFIGTAAGTQLTGSFTGSFKGDGSGLTGVPSSSFATNASTASYVLQAVSASFATKAITADSASFIGGAVTNNTDNRILTATGGGSINGESNLTFDGSTLTVTGNTIMTGDLTVAGTASFSNQTSLLIADRFILLASGSTNLTDAGIIASSGGLSGSAWYLEAGSAGSTGPYGRWATAFDLHASASVAVADEFAVTAKLSAASAPSDAVPPTWGSGSNGGGNIWVKQDTGDIYIWA